MSTVTKKYLIDLAERVFWTLAQVLVGILITESANWNPAYAVPIAGGLAILKGIIATRVGAPNTAALLPAGPDTEAG